MVETRDETDTPAPEQPEPEREPAAPTSEPGTGATAADAGHVCNVAFCPIGLALSAVQPLKPDVVEHLMLAGREFFLAAKALMDVRADDLSKDGVSPTFEKIDIG